MLALKAKNSSISSQGQLTPLILGGSRKICEAFLPAGHFVYLLMPCHGSRDGMCHPRNLFRVSEKYRKLWLYVIQMMFRK